MPGHIVELLGYVFTEITKCAAALWAARVVGLVNNVFVSQVCRQWFASRRLAGFRASPLRCIDCRRAIVGLQVFEPQFQLFDLAINLLRLAPELHALKLRDPQLQVLDFERPVRERFLERRHGIAQIRKITFALT
jgi:hypothetical protein